MVKGSADPFLFDTKNCERFLFCYDTHCFYEGVNDADDKTSKAAYEHAKLTVDEP